MSTGTAQREAGSARPRRHDSAAGGDSAGPGRGAFGTRRGRHAPRPRAARVPSGPRRGSTAESVGGNTDTPASDGCHDSSDVDAGVPVLPLGNQRPSGQAAATEWSFLAMADLRLAAWFLWMTPLLAALSSLRPASCINAVAVS